MWSDKASCGSDLTDTKRQDVRGEQWVASGEFSHKSTCETGDIEKFVYVISKSPACQCLKFQEGKSHKDSDP